MKPLRVLCLDIEGGYGGSSRSLYESLRYIDRTSIAPEVWCRREGPIRARYDALGIPCRVVPGMPKMNSLRRFSRNLAGYSIWLWEFLCWQRMRGELARTIKQRFDLVHFNHEGLFGLAVSLRRLHGKPQVMHVRTMILDNLFGRWQCRQMVAANDALVFISENERDTFERLAETKAEGSVIYNVAMPVADVIPYPTIRTDNRFKVAVLSNFAHMRGTDRVVEIAEALAARGRRDILFIVAGDMRLPHSLTGELGEIARAGGTLADYAAKRGVKDMILVLGHVAEPERVLAVCEVLLKPSRMSDPWGRDILEGLAAGKPVIAIGTYSRFVETGRTGFLFREFAIDKVADTILKLDSDRALCRDLGNRAMQRVAELCYGPDRARELAALWRAAVIGYKPCTRKS